MKNVGRMDAAIRVSLGLALLVTAAIVNARPFLAIAAALLGLLFLGTGLTRFCPLYTTVGLSTTPKARGT